MSEKPNTPELPWDVYLAVEKIEQQTRALLENCAKDAGLYGVLLDTARVTKIMRRSATESFRLRAAYYQSYQGFCSEWLDKAADETVAATINLAPLGLEAISSYQKIAPAITGELGDMLQEYIKERVNHQTAKASEGNGTPPDQRAPEKTSLSASGISPAPTPPKKPPQEPLPPKPRGAPKKPEAETTRSRWVEMGRPQLTSQVRDDLARFSYPSEFAKAKLSTKARKRLRDRVGRQVMLLIREAVPDVPAT